MTTTIREHLGDLDDAPGGSPEPVDPTQRPDVDPAPEPPAEGDDPEAHSPAPSR